jgi:prepilin-type N-terminal cleavage/methylation domain-containing protein
MKKRSGYTLIELIMALSLVGLVVIGVMSILSSMLQFSIQGTTRGDISGVTMLGLSRMTKEIEQATILTLPTTDGKQIAGCINFTRLGSTAYDTDQPTSWFNYCIKTPAAGEVQGIFRHGGDTCPSPITTVTCGSSPSTFTVVARHIYARDATTPIFSVDYSSSSAILHFIVGIATANVTNTQMPGSIDVAGGSGLKTPMPQALKVDTTIRSSKVFNNTNDGI